MFIPKLFVVLKEGYTRQQFTKDLTSGIIVGIVALPLAIAFGIASGVSPEKGLITAIIAGFTISAFGGSRVQIGGPTGAFIVIVYGIVEKYGVDGLTIATFMAGIILMAMGFARMGAIIKFIPHPLVVGFTSGIALIIFSSQMKDFFGLTMGTVPSDFIRKWHDYFLHIDSINIWAVIIAAATAFITISSPKFNTRIPGSLVAIVVSTAVVQIFHINVETIGSRFGEIPSVFPMPSVPHLDLETIKFLIKPAFAIALLGGIESLLSAVVADGMIGANHKSNVELVAQGGANILSAIFGGIPATGAIARTATNVKNGGRTPVAGIIHALVLLIIMLFIGKWAGLIPFSCLAGILVVVAYNMSEWKSFVSVLKCSKSEAAVLLITFGLTVFVDLTVAIEVGMVMAAFLFMHRMTQITHVEVLTKKQDENEHDLIENFKVPKNVEVFEVNGPLFFGAAFKFKESLRRIERNPKVLIIRMRAVPVIDASGLHTLQQVCKQTAHEKTKIILTEIPRGIHNELSKSRILFLVGKRNVTATIEEALERAQEILKEHHP